MVDVVNKWHVLRRLNAWQLQVVLGSPLVLLAIWAHLNSRGYVKTLNRIEAFETRGRPPDEQMKLATDTAYALAGALKYSPWRPKCLLRSLTLGWFLSRRGVPFRLCIGVPAGKPLFSTSGKPDWSAHAWVEHSGTVLNDKPNVAEEFIALDPRSGAA